MTKGYREREGTCSTRLVVDIISKHNRWAREEEVDSLWEGLCEEFRRDGADVHRQTGVPILIGLWWEEMWALESQMRNAMRGSRVSVGVYVQLDVRVYRVSSFDEGLETGR